MTSYAVNIGDPIPSFEIKDAEGYELTDEDLIGSPVVIYFYPKDNTPHCTTQACTFRDNMERLDALDTLVIGVSPDSEDSHLRFAEKNNLNFTLLSDEKMELCKKFDVHKGMLGIERTTFVIDGEGIVRWVERPVNVTGHVDRVIKAVQEITQSEEG